MIIQNKLTILFFIFAAFCQTVFSQVALMGTITDTNSEPVVNAFVELIDQIDATRRFSDYTDGQGRYLIWTTATHVENGQFQKPVDFNLSQNYPNPFNASTFIEYKLANPTIVRIQVYNVLGEKIKTLLSGYQSNLDGRVSWDATDDFGQAVPAGVYFYCLTVDGIRVNKKMLLVDGRQINCFSSGSNMNQLPLHKAASDIYMLRITGDGIRTYEQKAILLSTSTVLDVTVSRTDVTVTDIDGNTYKTVKIGDQLWMAENLKVTHYRNGDPIPNAADRAYWNDLNKRGIGCRCVKDDDPANVANFGWLYTWFAVNDSRHIAPEGWHVPSDAEWKELEMALGMSRDEANSIGRRGTDEGGKMKDTGLLEGTGFWKSPNTGATNESGLSVLPGGYRGRTCDFQWLYFEAHFWSSTQSNKIEACSRKLDYKRSNVARYKSDMDNGYSVRCIKD